MAMRLITLGTSHGDAGAPLGNTIYGIDSDQYLRWYKYLGNGDANPSPGLVNWDPNSGNPIGNGWGAVTLFQLGTAGTLMAIHDDGGLYWYRYDGDGHASVGLETGHHRLVVRHHPGPDLAVSGIHTDEVYSAMDWLLTRRRHRKTAGQKASGPGSEPVADRDVRPVLLLGDRATL